MQNKFNHNDASHESSKGISLNEGATRGVSAENELAALYKKLPAVPKGTEEYEAIRSDIGMCKDSIAAHADLFLRLLDAHNLERVQEFMESARILGKRFDEQVKELLTQDLTVTELIRLHRLINEQSNEFEERLRRHHAQIPTIKRPK